MPRKITNPSLQRSASDGLVAALATELKEPRDAGQPIILERHMELANAVQVYVIWDDFAEVAEEQRVAAILRAYECVMGKEFRDRITLATGTTVPEAADLELLPFEVAAAPRKDEAANQAKYRDALIAEGASILRDSDRPELRFETLEDATAAMERLELRMPGSRWVIVQAVSHDYHS